MKLLIGIFISVITFCLPSNNSNSYFCAYDYNNLRTNVGGQYIDLELSDYSGNDGLAHVVDQIKSITGLGNDFQVYYGKGFNNAYATYRDGEDWIIIDIDFLENINLQSGTEWGAISVIAHEIGHHYYRHMLTNGGSKSELEADYFSGRVLRALGASKSSSVKAILFIGSDYDSDSHPNKYKRKLMIERGWDIGY